MKDPLFYALKSIQEIAEIEPITNISPIIQDWDLDGCLPTVLKGIGLVEKTGKTWNWVGGNVDDDLVSFVRETANQYKNYAI